MAYLQAIFTTLWNIWTHRNRVIYEGLTPNPMSVILISQSMSCRYKEAFSEQPRHTSQPRRTNTHQYPPSGQWQLIVELAGARSRKPKRWSSAYEAINMQGDSIFHGVTDSASRTTCGAMLDVVVKAETHDIIHTFKNYFATVFLVFSFRKNKLYPNRPLVNDTKIPIKFRIKFRTFRW